MYMNHWVTVYALSDGCGRDIGCRLVVVEVAEMYRINGSFSGGSCTVVVAASVAANVP